LQNFLFFFYKGFTVFSALFVEDCFFFTEVIRRKRRRRGIETLTLLLSFFLRSTKVQIHKIFVDQFCHSKNKRRSIWQPYLIQFCSFVCSNRSSRYQAFKNNVAHISRTSFFFFKMVLVCNG